MNRILQKLNEIDRDQESGVLCLQKDSDYVNLHFNSGKLSQVESNIEIPSKGGASTNGVASWRRLLNPFRKEPTEFDQRQNGARKHYVIELLRVASRKNFEIEGFLPVANDGANNEESLNFDSEALHFELSRTEASPVGSDDQFFVLRNGRRPHLPWKPREVGVLNELCRPSKIEDISLKSGLKIDEVRSVLGTLQSMDMIRISDRPSEDVSPRLEPEEIVPEIKTPRYHEKVATFHNQESFVNEQFRSLKVTIAHIQKEHQARAFAITSPCVEDGKSLVTVNLAVTLARDPNRRVLLIDCDLRRPRIHEYLGIDLSPGLIGYLEDDSLSPYCFMRRHQRLFVLAAGGSTNRATEVLLGERMEHLMNEVREQFDFVIVDCPPFDLIPEVRILTDLTDRTLLVVRSGRTNYDSAQRTFERIDRKKLLGVVMNEVKPMRFHTYYDHSYYGSKKGLYPYYTKREK